MQEYIKPPGFPLAQATLGQGMTKHENPGDVVNGVRIPKKGVERKVAANKGKRVLLCPICSQPECPYTVEERS